MTDEVVEIAEIVETIESTEINFGHLHISYGALRLWQAGYGWLFYAVENELGVLESQINSAVWGTLFLLWCGTFAKNKAYNKIWLYLDMVAS